MLAFFPRYANLDTPVSYSETFVSEAVPSGERRIHIYIYIRRSEEECRAPAGIGRFASQIYAANICKAGLLLPCLMDWSVHVTFCFSRHSNHSIVRYRFNSLETVSSSRGGLLPLVSFPEGPRGGNFREGLVSWTDTGIQVMTTVWWVDL